METKSTGTRLAELRRSHAAGTHGKTKRSRKDRRNTNRKAINRSREEN